MYGGKFKGRQPESIKMEESEEIWKHLVTGKLDSQTQEH